MGFLMIDKVSRMVLGGTIEGEKTWPVSDPVFADHFPGMPIVPGTLITEASAQILGILLEKSFEARFEGRGVYPLLSIVNKAKFRRHTEPGERLVLKGTLGALDTAVGRGTVRSYVNDELRATCDLSFALVDKRRLDNDLLHRERARLMAGWLENAIVLQEAPRGAAESGGTDEGER